MFYDEQERANKPIAKYRGEVGLEIEVEGSNLPQVIKSYWRKDKDGSLRGDENAEYILKQPCSRKSVKKFMSYLNTCFKKHKAHIELSERTSVHVHLNVRDWPLFKCYNLILLYFLIEDLLGKLVGETRIGNLFCLGCRDAEYILDVLEEFARYRKFNPNPNQLRYSAVNICALTKFNSLEFRSLKGTTDPDIIQGWVTLLLALKDAAAKLPYPTDIVTEFSKRGPQGFIEYILPKHYQLFVDHPKFQQSLWEGLRLIQPIIYATDWAAVQKPNRLFEVNDLHIDDGD